jgi:hypothetical protein
MHAERRFLVEEAPSARARRMAGGAGRGWALWLALMVCGEAGGCVNRGFHVSVGSGGADGQVGSGGQAGQGDAGSDGIAGISGAAGGGSGGGGMLDAGGTGGATGGADGGGGAGGAVDAGTGGAVDAGTGGSADARTDAVADVRTDAVADANTNRCVPGVSPAAGLLTDFSAATWNASLATWGAPGNLTGKISTYGGGLAAGGLTTSVSATVDTTAANPALAIRGNVVAGDFAGVVLAFDQCVNTTAYQAVSFTLAGTVAGCDLLFQLETYSQQMVAAGGTCVTNCYRFPNQRIQVGTAPIVVTFAALAGTGQPATTDGLRAEIIGLHLQFQSPAPAAGGPQPNCAGINLTLDNVQLVSN